MYSLKNCSFALVLFCLSSSFAEALPSNEMSPGVPKVWTCTVNGLIGNDCSYPLGCERYNFSGTFSSVDENAGKSGAVMRAVQTFTSVAGGSRVSELSVESCSADGVMVSLCSIAGIPCSGN